MRRSRLLLNYISVELRPRFFCRWLERHTKLLSGYSPLICPHQRPYFRCRWGFCHCYSCSGCQGDVPQLCRGHRVPCIGCSRQINPFCRVDARRFSTTTILLTLHCGRHHCVASRGRFHHCGLHVLVGCCVGRVRGIPLDS